MRLMIIFVVLFLPCVSWAENFKSLPNEPRYVKWVDAYTYKIPVGKKPMWQYDLRWQGDGKPAMFIAESPQYYYPSAVINANHFIDNKAPSGDRDFRFFAKGAIESIAKNYGYANELLPKINYSKKGQLSGYEVVVEGKVDGANRDVIIYFAAAPDRTVFSLVAHTLPGKALHLKNMFDRTAINVEFPAGTLKGFDE